MSPIDCDRFAAVLADLLAEPPSGPSDPRAEALRDHAARCPACAEAADLLALASTPAERRDPIDDPGAAYWDEFGERLNARLGARRKRGRILALASAAAVAGAIVWVAIPRRAEVGSPSATALPAAGLDDAAPADDDASAAFDGAEPLDAFDDDDGAALFPALDQLSPAESERLRLWLEQEEARVKRGRT